MLVQAVEGRKRKVILILPFLSCPIGCGRAIFCCFYMTTELLYREFRILSSSNPKSWGWVISKEDAREHRGYAASLSEKQKL